jgi:hypothetical protein
MEQMFTENEIQKMRHLALGLNPDVLQALEACASCAIEGNEWAQKACDLWNSGQREEFVRYVSPVLGLGK